MHIKSKVRVYPCLAGDLAIWNRGDGWKDRVGRKELTSLTLHKTLGHSPWSGRMALHAQERAALGRTLSFKAYRAQEAFKSLNKGNPNFCSVSGWCWFCVTRLDKNYFTVPHHSQTVFCRIWDPPHLCAGESQQQGREEKNRTSKVRWASPSTMNINNLINIIMT